MSAASFSENYDTRVKFWPIMFQNSVFLGKSMISMTMFITCSFLVQQVRFTIKLTATICSLQAYFKEPATAFFRAEGRSSYEFCCIFNVFLLRGSTPETSGKTLGTPQGLKVSFWKHFWFPWAPLCAPLECLRSPWCLIGHTFPPQTVPKERKVGTVCRRRVLVAFKHPKALTATS